ncbi:MAG: hypothetical protein Q4G69_09415 [Planctomycetia bacterium]|nr:hypothetical protein [Planctomycetia bacterium]
MKTQLIAFVILILFLPSAVFAQKNTSLYQKEKDLIAQRAKEIEPLLSETPTVFGAPFSDREAWSKILELPAGKAAVKKGHKILNDPVADIPEDLYKLFYKMGNRTQYQKARSKWSNRLETLVVAELYENKGTFVPAIEEMIRRFCAYPSWILPAHDPDAKTYDGKATVSDLVSTATGCTMGLIANWMKDSLSPETQKLIRENVQRRVLDPYKKTILNPSGKRSIWWHRGANNWNAVCTMGTIAAALSLCESREDRAWYIAAAEYFTKEYFFKGFTPDGYCSEGMGYWNYGFGHFIYLGAMIKYATQDKIDFFQWPLVKECTLFGPNMEIADNIFAAYADCPPSAKPGNTYVAYMSRTLGLHLSKYEKNGLFPNCGTTSLFNLAFFCFDPNIFPDPQAETETEADLPIRTEFPDAGILICRPNPENRKITFAVSMKAGHNSENHNHNDIGSWTLLLTKKDSKGSITAKTMILDPGGEVYTRRTFSKDRYVGELLSSFGHPVPRINGTLQRTGRKAEGRITERNFSEEEDTYSIDLTSAYEVKDLKSICRTFHYYRKTPDQYIKYLSNSEKAEGAFAVEDKIAFSGVPGTIDSPLITNEKAIASEEKGEIWIITLGEKEKIQIRVSAVDTEGKSIPLAMEKTIVGEHDDSVRTKPTRLGFKNIDPVKDATVRFLIVP